MQCPKPHYLLFCDGNYPSRDLAAATPSRSATTGAAIGWRFVLENLDSGNKFEASDRETGATSDRAALVAVLRGLEALEQPSRVTLVTTSRYVFRGLQYGLSEWRENDYSWEHFGTVQPIRNADMWRRIDRTLQFHQVQCRWMSGGDEPISEKGSGSCQNPESAGNAKPDEAETTVLPSVERSDPQSARSNESPIATNLQNSQVVVVERLNPLMGPDCFPRVSQSNSIDSPRAVAIFKDSLSPTNVNNDTRSAECRVFQNTWVDSSRPLAEEGTASVPAADGTQKIRTPLAGLKSSLIACRDGAWNAILWVDEAIESYLRCLFLLDPPTRPRR